MPDDPSPSPGPVPLRVALVVRHRVLRRAIEEILQAEGAEVILCDALAALDEVASGQPGEVALADWTLTQGLLAPEQRPALHRLVEAIPLVIMVPGSWHNLVTAEGLGVSALLPKPFEAEQLLGLLRAAARSASPALSTGGN